MLITPQDFKKRIEFSLCQQFASEEDLRAFCHEAKTTGVGVACVNPIYVARTVELLGDVDIEISANIGFPFGSHLAEVKALETALAVQDGATQIDMVMNVGALKSGQDELARKDIEAVVARAEGRVVKVIIETWVLTGEEKVRASQIVEAGGAHMVKTSTGVRTQYLKMVNSNPQGATLEDIKLIRSAVSARMRVKASGGIYTLEDAVSFLRAGADQLGASKGAELIQAFEQAYPDGLEL